MQTFLVYPVENGKELVAVGTELSAISVKKLLAAANVKDVMTAKRGVWMHFLSGLEFAVYSLSPWEKVATFVRASAHAPLVLEKP